MNVAVERSCLARIRAQLPQLTAVERLVGETVLQDPNALLLASLTEVAEAAETSESTVSRFVQHVGYSSFAHFKIALAQDLVSPSHIPVHEDVAPDDSLDVVSRKILQSSAQALLDTEAVLDKAALEKAVAILSDAERIAFFGMGGSGIVALDAQHKFVRTGKTVVAYSDSHQQLVFTVLADARDAIVLVSHSGASRDVLQVAERARAKGARTIAVTHLGKPPLARLVDVHLCTASRETLYLPEALSSRVAALGILDILYVAVARAGGEMTNENLAAIRHAFEDRRV